MSRTLKDSSRGTVLRVIKKDDEAFDVLLNREMVNESVPVDGLESILCRRFGYCQDELATILLELEANGRADRYL